MVQVTPPQSECKSLKEVAGHTGQSSQLFPVATGRNAQFLATIQIGLNVSHTGKDETDRVWIPLTLAARSPRPSNTRSLAQQAAVWLSPFNDLAVAAGLESESQAR